MAVYAAVDIGTNSTRLLIGRVEAGVIVAEHFGLHSTRLGEGMGGQARLGGPAMARTLTALREYRQLADKYQLQGWRVVATSAVRDADNGIAFAQMVEREIGWTVEIISGQEEAALSYLGAVKALGNAARPVVVDIGGGSTEFTWTDAQGCLNSRSVNLGAVRLTESKPAAAELMHRLAPVLDELKDEPIDCLVGVGGTATTLAAMEQRLATYDPNQVQGFYLARETVTRWLNALSTMNLAERRQLPGLQPARADIIVAGVEILSAVLHGLNQNGLIVSDSDILQGMVWLMAEGRKE